MGSGFNVNVGEVRVHASAVATLATQVRSASSTAQASVSDNAFGLIGQFFAAAIMQASDDVRDGIVRAGQSVDDVHTGLRDTADVYQQVDESNAVRLGIAKVEDAS